MDRDRKGRQGLSRITALLLVLVIVMSILIIIPTVRSCNANGESAACAAGLDTATRRLAQDIIEGDTNQDAQKAIEIVTTAMNGWDDLCPGGGKVYLVRTRKGDIPFELVCGKHDPDKKRCTRLNSNYVLSQLKEALRKSQLMGQPYPQELTFQLNGERWKARLTDEEMGFRRGTSTTKGYEKQRVAVFYGIMGHSTFKAGSGTEEGKICYFSFADEYHCAIWASDDGWTGDSYAAR